jgi:hypothetical protein
MPMSPGGPALQLAGEVALEEAKRAEIDGGGARGDGHRLGLDGVAAAFEAEGEAQVLDRLDVVEHEAPSLLLSTPSSGPPPPACTRTPASGRTALVIHDPPAHT